MNTPSSAPFALTNDTTIDAMTHGYYWNLDANRTINWSLSNGFLGESWSSNIVMIGAVRNALANIASYADIKFNYLGTYSSPLTASAAGSDINVSLDSLLFFSSPYEWAIGFFPDSSNNSYYAGAAGDVFLNANSAAVSFSSYTAGTAGFSLLLHELSHTLGLKHPHDDGGTGRPTFTQAGIASLDINWTTVMSYNDDFSYSLSSHKPATLMVMDVLAMQYLYGVNTTTNATDTTYSLIQSNNYQTYWDAGGTDTVSISPTYTNWTIELPDTQLSDLVATKSGMAAPTAELAYHSPNTLYWLMGDIENASGSYGNDTLLGSSLDNILNGGGGNDQMQGGAGNDTYYVDTALDIIVENANEGIDNVFSSTSYTLGNNIETITLTQYQDINATGNSLDNMLTGNTVNNILDGGAGADTLIGGGGSDTYVVDNIGDQVTETLNGGNDTVRSSISYTLSTYLENITLIGNNNIDATGNDLDNVLSGNIGSNQLAGGLGNDTYYSVDNGDTIIENTDAGTDAVFSDVSWTLDANIENLTLQGSDAINGTGNSLDNIIKGNISNNTLNGGTGTDTLIGGAGNDIYLIDGTDDVLVEDLNGGTDTVQSYVSLSLAANFENLTLLGLAPINGTGNAANNLIIGNTGNNVLDGATGADTLQGGDGNDTYFINSSDDVITENSNEGYDAVFTSMSYTLGVNIEKLVLGSTANLNGTGNTADNEIIGTAGSNILDGGSGADTLIGGAGNDTYIIDNNNDVVVENSSEGTDLVQSSTSYWVLGANIENLTLTGTGNTGAEGNDSDNILTGNIGNNILLGGLGKDKMIGGKGDDTYGIDNTSDVITENANEGTDTIQSSMTWTLSANFENLTLVGNAHINALGNAGVNILIGNAGNNTLNGGTGADSMLGNGGDDTFIVDNLGDSVSENANEGTDNVQSSVTFTLTANIENLTLTGYSVINGTGNALDNVFVGNMQRNQFIGGDGNDTYYIGTGDSVFENSAEGIDSIYTTATYTLGNNLENLFLSGIALANAFGNELDNILTGNTAANTLNGGAGIDSLTGGKGNDIYVVDNIGDSVVEYINEGTDTVQSSISYTLGANLENLTLTGADNTDGIGNALANIIIGNIGNNTLDGGLGKDKMTGGKGNDTYTIDDIGDALTENLNEGTDSVYSSISYTLGANFESLTLTGTGNINGTGNTLANTIIGNAGNNTLNGATGADTMSGHDGNDLYIIDNIGDAVTENLNEGIDSVQSSVTFILTSYLENLTLTGFSAINGTGNDLDNAITGNMSANILDGGAGADTLVGGAGNDTYIIDNVGDIVIESSYGGTDTILSTLSHTLAVNTENLTLTGTDSVDGTGNALANILTGNGGNNILSGDNGTDTLIGGAGNDTLIGGAAADKMTGGADSDSFKFTVSSMGSSDTITDFSTSQGDTLDIHDILVGFDSLTSAITDFIQITNSALNSIVKIDRDGTGTSYSWTQIATLTGITGLTNEAQLLADGTITV